MGSYRRKTSAAETGNAEKGTNFRSSRFFVKRATASRSLCAIYGQVDQTSTIVNFKDYLENMEYVVESSSRINIEHAILRTH